MTSKKDRPGAPTPEPAPEPAAPQTARVTRTGRSQPCLRCGSRDVARITYGFAAPGRYGDPAYLSGEYFFGGCCVSDGTPTCLCHACGHKWREN